MIRSRLRSVPRGLRYMAYGAFWFSLMSLLVKLAGRGLPSLQIVLVRALITLALSWILLRRARVPLPGTHLRMLLLRGLLGALALICFYFSLVHLPLAEATVFQYTNPVWTAVLAGIVLGERLGWRQAACVGASLVGVILIARPASLLGGAPALDPTHVWIALAGALGSAGAYVIVRKMGTAEHPLLVVFYFPLVTVPLTLPFVLPMWTWPTPGEWAILAGIGVTTQIAQVYLTRGLQLEPAGRATAVAYLQIVFAAMWGAIVFAEWPDAWSIAGALIILGSTAFIALGRRRPTETPGSGAGASPLGERRTTSRSPDPADAGAR